MIKKMKTEHNPNSYTNDLVTNRQAPKQELPEETQQKLLHQILFTCLLVAKHSKLLKKGPETKS